MAVFLRGEAPAGDHSRRSGVLLTQYLLLDLAHAVARQVGDKMDALRHFEVGQNALQFTLPDSKCLFLFFIPLHGPPSPVSCHRTGCDAATASPFREEGGHFLPVPPAAFIIELKLILPEALRLMEIPRIASHHIRYGTDQANLHE